jgi:hypothetical protein
MTSQPQPTFDEMWTAVYRAGLRMRDWRRVSVEPTIAVYDEMDGYMGTLTLTVDGWEVSARLTSDRRTLTRLSRS